VSADYSGTPLVRKLGIKAGSPVLLVGAPELPDLTPLPAGVTLSRRVGRGPYDLILLFCPDAATLRRRFAGLVPHLSTAGGLWACWVKRASGISTDLGEQAVRDHGLEAGLVDVKVAAIDATWSGLKFVRRRSDRAGEARVR
jgi:hypothetical protein